MFCALVERWTCIWYFAFKLISFHVWMFTPHVNEHCGHYSIVIACMVKPWFIVLFHFTWSHYVCFICITSFLYIMIKLCCCVSCWTCKWYFAFKLISFHVWMFTPHVNEHYGHYSIVIACMVKPWFVVLFHFTWSHYVCFICITSFLHIIIKLCCCVSRDTCSYDSRASQILEFVLGFCHEIAKWGNCKVESNQPSCWLYSVPNLLVI